METITDPYALAEAGICHYYGDCNPLDYDGAWYESANWDRYDYANCVRVTCLPDGPDGGKHLIVEKITINKPRDMKSALDSFGIEGADRDNIHAQIEACLGYGHYDPSQGDGCDPSSLSVVIPDDEDEEAGAFKDYCRIHGAVIVTEMEVWEVLSDWVGRHSCA